MKKTALIYLICSMVVAITVIIAVMLPIVFSDRFLPEDNEIDEPINGKLILSSASATAIYDGTALMDIEWHLVSGSLAKGHRLSVEVSGSQTNVGISENHISATVLDKNGKNVSSQYDIEYEVGLLEVKPREICIVADSDMKVYDGTPLTADGYTLESGLSLAHDHYLDVTITGSIVEVGSVDNVVESVAVYNKKGIDVTSNYNITSINGKLVVYDERALVFESFSDVKRYDGIALTNSLWRLISGSMQSTHKAEVKVTGARTHPGESDNVFDVRIVDEYGTDVTSSYEIVCIYGTLTVLRGEVTISSNDDQKIYDGYPLTNSGYTVSPESLMSAGFTFDVVITGEQLEIGSSENTIESVNIYNENGEDVRDYFVVITKNGLLTVNEDNESGGEGGGGGGLDLSGGIGSAGGKEEDNTASFIILTNTEGTLYLKVKSFGAYCGNVWDDAVEYDAMPDDEIFATYLPTYAISQQPISESYIEITSFTGEYVLPYYAINENCQPQISDVLVSGDASEKYCLKYYAWDFEREVKIPTEIRSFEVKYRKFVHNQYLDIDMATYNYLHNILNEMGWNKRDPDVIDKVASYIQNAATYSLEYDATLDESENVVIAFLSEYKEGICQHYASAATMMFRALGIPARYTIGYAVPAKAGEETVVTGAMAHAWVEVYVDGLGWIQVEVTGTDPDAEGGDTPGGDTPGGEIPGGDFEEGDASIGGSSNGSMLQPDNPIGDDVVVFYLTGSAKGTVYLKMKSYGDLNAQKNGWNEAPEFGEYAPDGKSAFYLTSLALDNSGMKPITLTIDPVAPIFVLPYYSYNGSFGNQMSDVFVSGDSMSSYDVNYFSWNGVFGPELPSKYKSYEAAYEEYVRSTYLTVDDETRSFMEKIIAENGFDVNDPTIINDVAKYIKNAAVYNLKYDTNMDNESNVIIAFLSKYREGVCRHYASAATLLFRSLGIPARYTEGFLGDVMAGSTTEVTAGKGHAWVEVYISGIGWVNLEVTGSPAANVAKQELTIYPTYTGEQYHGQMIFANQTITGFEKLEEKGYSYSVTISGSRDILGISESEIIDFKIYDPFGELVYDRETGLGTDQFKITYKKGVVQLYIDYLVFSSESLSKVYDGMPLVGYESGVMLVSGELLEDEMYVLTLSASIENVGKISNSYRVEIYRNGVLINDYYRIEKRYGFLEIKAREISIQAGSATKAYDGTELICNEIVYDPSQLAPGDRIEMFIVEGSQTYIGEAVNVVRSVIIKNQSGKNVTKNYSIATVDGILKVTIP